MKIIKASKGICDSTAQPGDMLQVHYTGRFDDENGKIFDSSHNHGQLYQFQLGAGQVSTLFFHFSNKIIHGMRHVSIIQNRSKMLLGYFITEFPLKTVYS